MTRTGAARIDRGREAGARTAQRLDRERAAWLTTVSPKGVPQSSPVWFTWDEEEIVVYSLESARVRNIEAHPQVGFNLDGNRMGGEIVIVEGEARVDRGLPSAAENRSYLAKYRPVMEERGWTPEWFAGRYSAPIRITPIRYRYW